jgi:hypothetical protein
MPRIFDSNLIVVWLSFPAAMESPIRASIASPISSPKPITKLDVPRPLNFAFCQRANLTCVLAISSDGS